MPNESPAFAHTIPTEYQTVKKTEKEMETGEPKEEGRKGNTLCISFQDIGKILHT
jgi:hypothetical protein